MVTATRPAISTMWENLGTTSPNNRRSGGPACLRAPGSQDEGDRHQEGQDREHHGDPDQGIEGGGSEGSYRLVDQPEEDGSAANKGHRPAGVDHAPPFRSHHPSPIAWAKYPGVRL